METRNRPTEHKVSFALEVLMHPDGFDDSDKEESITVAVNALRYVLHEIREEELEYDRLF